MYSNKPIMTSTTRCSERSDALAEELARAEAVLIGAGAGLSTAAGLTYDGPRFARLFPDFIQAYGFTDMYTAGFARFGAPEIFWAYWSRHIFCNRYEAPVGAPYRDLLSLVKDKDYFVLTTNVDHQFQRAGFDKARLFYTQGDYGLWQCAKPCHNKTYDNEAAVRRMVAEQKDMRIPSALIPRCPVCGGPMAMNLRCDEKFVEDEGWQKASARYLSFVQRVRSRRVLFLELGVGSNTPGIIKYPFWQMTAQCPHARYACVNATAQPIPENIVDRAIVWQGDLSGALRQLATR